LPAQAEDGLQHANMRLAAGHYKSPACPRYRLRFEHEIGTNFVVKGKGLVVLTSCSHRGIINTIRQAQA